MRRLALALALLPGTAAAVDIVPHRAIYTMSLERAQSSSGVTGAGGSMLFQWGNACDGWTIEQRYKLTMQYSDQDPAELSISFVTWEAKDGRRYRYNVRKLRDGEPSEELRGEANSPATGPGEARFTKPAAETVELPPGTLFPTGHTLALIDAAQRGESFVSRHVFDGGTEDGAFEVTAGIGAEQAPGKDDDALMKSRWWPVRMAFFPEGSQSPQPEYELGMDLQENGIARGLTLDYGNFVVRARLRSVEQLPKPVCD